jgi:hypothetical protein
VTSALTKLNTQFSITTTTSAQLGTGVSPSILPDISQTLTRSKVIIKLKRYLYISYWSLKTYTLWRILISITGTGRAEGNQITLSFFFKDD